MDSLALIWAWIYKGQSSLWFDCPCCVGASQTLPIDAQLGGHEYSRWKTELNSGPAVTWVMYLSFKNSVNWPTIVAEGVSMQINQTLCICLGNEPKSSSQTVSKDVIIKAWYFLGINEIVFWMSIKTAKGCLLGQGTWAWIPEQAVHTIL